MKHTRLYILSMMAATLTLLAGCTTEDAMETPDTPVGNSTPLTFSAKVNTIGTRTDGTGTDGTGTDGTGTDGTGTDGTVTGSIDYSVLTKYGFGVFAYFADGQDGLMMDNQKVVYEGKNAGGTVGNLGDVHEHTANWSYDKEIMWGNKIISFLAYAPYIDSSNPLAPSNSLDPFIPYKISTNPVDGVDLLWGVREDANDKVEKREKRMPWLNTAAAAGEGVENVANGGGITFSFHHALSAIAFHVQAMIDKDNDQGDFEDESNVGGILTSDGGDYKITLESITLSGDFYEKANLYLENKISGKPRWENQTVFENNEIATPTLKVEPKHIDPAFSHPTDITKADDEKPEAFREKIAKAIIENETITGITQEAEQLVIIPHSKTGAEQCFFVIPNEEEQTYTLTVKWYLSYKKLDGRTYDMDEHVSEISIDSWALNPETKYYLNLVFGLKSVRLNVTATDWENNPINMEDIIENGTSANESLSRPLR